MRGEGKRLVLKENRQGQSEIFGTPLLPANSNQIQHDFFHWSTKKGGIKRGVFLFKASITHTSPKLRGGEVGGEIYSDNLFAKYLRLT